jgi:hypothetical protein
MAYRVFAVWETFKFDGHRKQYSRELGIALSDDDVDALICNAVLPIEAMDFCEFKKVPIADTLPS